MIEPAYLGVLRTIYMRLQGTDISWVVTGSLSFVLQGVPVTPNDIDLQTNATAAYEIQRMFSECVVRKVSFSSTEKIRSHFGTLLINGIKVEIMGGIQKRLEDGTWEEPVEIERHKQFVEIASMQIPVLSLEYEYQAYLALGRLETAQMLRKVLF